MDIDSNTSNMVQVTSSPSSLSVSTPIPYAQNTPAHIEDDYAFARKNLYDIMRIGIKSMEELANIATASQHIRSYEAMAALLKSVSDTNDKLLILQNNRQALEDHEVVDDNDSSGKLIINSGNTVFCGSTAELQQLLQTKLLSNKS